MIPTAAFWAGKRVLVTGHTGFKGSWLTLWLHQLGANVTGVSLAPEHPSLYELGQVASHCTSHFVDVRDMETLKRVVAACDADIVFHLAAQSLVLRSYAEPLSTWQTNVMGTLHLLEILREQRRPAAIVVVTSDKCYENSAASARAFVEADALGGHDPYSSSKAAVEIATRSWRASFFGTHSHGLASARAGNVIGGGDWAEHRLLPDLLRALSDGRAVTLRHPGAVRPWQHVLEPLCGYLQLAAALYREPLRYSGAWNFGPASDAMLTVSEVVDMVAAVHPGLRWSQAEGDVPHEAASLSLDSSKARSLLGWTPRWSAKEAVDATLAWYGATQAGADGATLCLAQIAAYASREVAVTSVPQEVSHGA